MILNNKAPIYIFFLKINSLGKFGYLNSKEFKKKKFLELVSFPLNFDPKKNDFNTRRLNCTLA